MTRIIFTWKKRHHCVLQFLSRLNQLSFSGRKHVLFVTRQALSDRYHVNCMIYSYRIGTRLKYLMQEKLYWPELQGNVELYMTFCDTCYQAKMKI